MDFKDVSLTDILKIFSKQSNLNFIASQDVADKKITLFLNGVPFNEALKEILDANGLVYEMQEDSNVFIVKAKPKDEESQDHKSLSAQIRHCFFIKIKFHYFHCVGFMRAPAHRQGRAGRCGQGFSV